MALKMKKTKEEIILDLVISLNQSSRDLRSDQIVNMAFEEYNCMEQLMNQKRNKVEAPMQFGDQYNYLIDRRINT